MIENGMVVGAEQEWERLYEPDAWDRDDPDGLDIADLMETKGTHLNALRSYIEDKQDDGEIFLQIYASGALNGMSLKLTLGKLDVDDQISEVDAIITDYWQDDSFMQKVWESLDDDIIEAIGDRVKENADYNGIRRQYNEWRQ